jgi:hypothetical protein
MKAIYYRGTELVTAEEKALLEKIYPCKDNVYNTFEELEWYADWNTAILDVVNILATIQCNQSLNERETALIARIEKGLTYSKAYGVDYVERNLLAKLINDAVDQFRKDNPEADPINPYKYWNDIYRIYKLPFKGILAKATIANNYLIGYAITEPAKIYDVKFTVSQWPNLAYKCYNVLSSEVPELNKYHIRYKKGGEVYKKHPYAGKVYFSSLYDDPSKHYWQIYVYDYANSDWAFQNILNYLYSLVSC